MAIEKILVPDIGNFDSVDVIEVIAKIGDVIKKDDPLITLESDKASMDIPAPSAGTVKEILLKVGDKIITKSGLHGKVAELADATVVIETMAGKLKMERSAISMEMSASLNKK